MDLGDIAVVAVDVEGSNDDSGDGPAEDVAVTVVALVVVAGASMAKNVPALASLGTGYATAANWNLTNTAHAQSPVCEWRLENSAQESTLELATLNLWVIGTQTSVEGAVVV